MAVMETTQASRVMRLAELPPHEAFAVFAKLYEEMLLDAQRLAERLQEFERLESGLALSLGKAREAEAGSKFFLDDDPEAQAYLAELVDRVDEADVNDGERLRNMASAVRHTSMAADHAETAAECLRQTSSGRPGGDDA